MSIFSSPVISDTIFTPIANTFTNPTKNTIISDVIYSPSSSSSAFFSDPYVSDTIITPLNKYTNDVITLSPYSSPLTLSFDYNKPLIGVYETIDNNPNVRRKMIKYYYDMVRDQWLLDELNDILNYFSYDDGKVRLISSLSDYSPKNIAKDTDRIAERKVEFIENTILTKYDMAEILNKFTKNMHIKWVDIPKHEFMLRQAIREYLMKEINRKLRKRQSRE